MYAARLLSGAWGDVDRSPKTGLHPVFFLLRYLLPLEMSERMEGVLMQFRILTTLFLCSFFVAVGGDAQSPKATEKPVWTLEFLKVRPEHFGPALGDLDDHWMRVLKEAKREGAVLSYHRITDVLLTTPRIKEGDPKTIVMVTEYKDVATFMDHEKLFASIREHLPSTTPGVLRQQYEDLYQIVDSRAFMEVPDGDSEWRLLAQQ
jgi:hypothetical protein